MGEVIRKLVKNPKFEEAILNKIGSRIDTEEIEKEIEGLEKQHRQLTGAKARLGQCIPEGIAGRPDRCTDGRCTGRIR